MGYKVAHTTGAWSLATIWDTVANVPTMHATTNITITNSDKFTLAFTAPNITNKVTGCLIYVAVAGTKDITITLQENNVDTVCTVTVPVAQIAVGWIYFRFPTPYQYTATTAGYYRFKIRTATTNTATVAADSGAANPMFMATDDRNAIAAANDNVFIQRPNNTGSVIVTVDGSQAAGLTSGNDVAFPAVRSILYGLIISQGATLKWDTAVSATLVLTGSMVNYLGALQMQPASASVISRLSFAPAVSGDFSLRIWPGSTLLLQGTPKTSTSLWRTKYVSGDGSSGSPLVVADAVDWAVGDEICVGADSDNAQNYLESEMRHIVSKNSATSFVLEGADLVLNGGFETGGGSPFVNWTSTVGAGGSVTQDSASPHGGTYSAKVLRGTANTYITQNITVVPGRLYELNFYEKNNGVAAGRYTILDVTNGGATIVAVTTVPVSAAWQLVTVQFQAPYGCVTASINLYSPATNSTFSNFDDVTLKLPKLNYTHTSDSEIVNSERNVIIDTNNYARAWGGLYQASTVVGEIQCSWARFETCGVSTASRQGIYLSSVANVVSAFDYCVVYRQKYYGFIHQTSKQLLTSNGLVAVNASATASTGGIVVLSTGNNKVFNDCIAIKHNKMGIQTSASYNITFNRCKAISCNTTPTAGLGGFYFAGGLIYLNDCESHCNAITGMALVGALDVVIDGYLSGGKGYNAADFLTTIDTYNTALVKNSYVSSPTIVATGYMDQIPGSVLKFSNVNGINNDFDYNVLGTFQKTGMGLTDTTVHTAGGYAIRLHPEDITQPLFWDQDVPTGDIQNKAMAVVIWAKINNAAYWAGTHQMPRLTVTYDDGSVVYAQMAQNTEWQQLFVSFTPTTSFPSINVKVGGYTDATGTNAQFYFDDCSVLYPAGVTVNLGSLDLWSKGFPLVPTIATLFSANDVVAALPEIKYAAFNGGVTIDVVNGVAGISYPNGTVGTPVNNLADALSIAVTQGFKNLYIKGNLTIGATDVIDGYTLIGENPSTTTITLTAGASTIAAKMKSLTLTGTCGGRMDIADSRLTEIIGLCASGGDANIFNTMLKGNIQLKSVANQHFNFDNCFGGSPDDVPDMDVNGCTAEIVFNNYSGPIILKNATQAGQNISLDINSGFLTLDSTVTQGVISVRGIAKFVNETTPQAGLSIDTSGLLKPVDEQYRGRIYVSSTGSAGTSYPLGLIDTPVNNMADAIILAQKYNANDIHLHSDITVLTGTVIDFYVISGHLGYTITFQSGCTTTDLKFQDIIVTGALNGVCEFNNCKIKDVTGLEGKINGCTFQGTIGFKNSGLSVSILSSCRSFDQTSVILNIADSIFNAINIFGMFTVYNKTGAGEFNMHLGYGIITVDASCVAGDIYIGGNGQVIDNSVGSNVVDDTGNIATVSKNVITNQDLILTQ